MFPPPSARSTSENPPTAARRTSSDSRTDASAGGDRTAAPREQSAKPERKGLLGRLLGGRRNDSPDEVERWWAVDDEDKNDPFAEPPAGDDRPRVPGQR
jgi:hypothetical protein